MRQGTSEGEVPAMNKLIQLTLIATLSVLSAPADADPVTWSFYETGIGSCSPFQCTPPPLPHVFATLTLPGPTSSGSAFWQGPPVGPPPVYTGDSFSLSIEHVPTLSPAFAGNNIITCPNGVPNIICDFDISWTETAGQLNAISINIDTGDTNIGRNAPARGGDFGLSGGPIATDFFGVGGCNDSVCEITGFWQSDLSVSEPGTLALLMTGLLGIWLARRSARSWANVA
jgi:hypothetical protein